MLESIKLFKNVIKPETPKQKKYIDLLNIKWPIIKRNSI